jgi:hypothetical protein
MMLKYFYKISGTFGSFAVVRSAWLHDVHGADLVELSMVGHKGTTGERTKQQRKRHARTSTGHLVRAWLIT